MTIMIRAALLTLLIGGALAVSALAALDMGDLDRCNYPTLYANPGHTTSGIAWLGHSITADAAPHILNMDDGDDGIAFLNPQWEPCTEVSVACTVTAGPHYPNWVGTLYLNGWKDGNLDGDFCDTLCPSVTGGPGTAPEWIVQDEVVTPGVHHFTFKDPGVRYLGTYPGVFRFRLSQRPLGAFGFGHLEPDSCPGMCGSPDGMSFDTCGEVEDYIIRDLQLAVELGGFAIEAGDQEAVLMWSTNSETDNDRFEIERDGMLMAVVPSKGNSPTGFDYSFTDQGLENGRLYEYRLSCVHLTGERELLRTATVIPVGSVAASPAEFTLHQNYPNPFNPSTQIVFDLKSDAWVSLVVYDLQGREIAVLQNGAMTQGRYTVSFDGSALPSGIYFCRLHAGNFSSEIKMMLLK